MAPRLLVLDPDPGSRQILQEFLASAGFQSDETSDLDGALARLAEGHPAAVVLHDGIGGAQGLAVLQSLRAHHADIPVVFIAWGGDREPGATAARLAATACVNKPFRMADLLAAVVRTVHGAERPRRTGGVLSLSERRANGRRHHPAETADLLRGRTA